MSKLVSIAQLSITNNTTLKTATNFVEIFEYSGNNQKIIRIAAI
jgi:hypothetical protein